MRVFAIPAKYRPFIEGKIALAIKEAERDARFREDDDATIRSWAMSEQFLDNDATGDLAILVMHEMPGECPPPDAVDAPDRAVRASRAAGTVQSPARAGGSGVSASHTNGARHAHPEI